MGSAIPAEKVQSLDEARQRVPLHIDGELRHLRFTQRAVREITDKLELKGLAELANVFRDLGQRELQICVWAGLLHESPDLNVEDLDECVIPLVAMAKAVTDGLNLALFGDIRGAVHDTEGPPKLRRPKRSTKRTAKPGASRAGASGSRRKSSGR